MPSQSKNSLERVYAIIQFYGKIMAGHSMVIESDENIIEKNSFCAINVGKLLHLRTVRCQSWMTLQAIAEELESKHGVKMPWVAGWELIDEDSFCLDPFPSPRNVYHC